MSSITTVQGLRQQVVNLLWNIVWECPTFVERIRRNIDRLLDGVSIEFSVMVPEVKMIMDTFVYCNHLWPGCTTLGEGEEFVRFVQQITSVDQDLDISTVSSAVPVTPPSEIDRARLIRLFAYMLHLICSEGMLSSLIPRDCGYWDKLCVAKRYNFNSSQSLKELLSFEEYVRLYVTTTALCNGLEEYEGEGEKNLLQVLHDTRFRSTITVPSVDHLVCYRKLRNVLGF